jgi:hypothetical protein
MNKLTRISISLLTLWSFINTAVLILGYTQKRRPKDVEFFYPFPHKSLVRYSNDYPLAEFGDILLKYDFSEFFVYSLAPWLLFLLYKFATKK